MPFSLHVNGRPNLGSALSETAEGDSLLTKEGGNYGAPALDTQMRHPLNFSSVSGGKGRPASRVSACLKGQPPSRITLNLYHSRDAGQHWQGVSDATLPEKYDRVPVVLFADDAVWVATQTGQVFGAEDVAGPWTLVCELPVTIYAAAAEGSVSSVDSGFRR
jgi:photosystem II stability/assembly factor-like uncharacterized protein